MDFFNRHFRLIIAASVFIALAGVALELEVLARLMVAMIHPPMFGTREMDLKYDLAKSPPRNGAATIFFLGTSYTCRTVCADLIQLRLNQAGYRVNCLNLASSGNFTSEQLFLLKTAIAHGATPAAVVYELIPLGLDAREVHHFSSVFLNSPQGKLIKPPAGSGITDRVNRYLNKHSILVRYLPTLAQNCMHLPQMVLKPEVDYNPGLEFANSNRCTPCGWVPKRNILRATDDDQSNTQLRFNTIKSNVARDYGDSQQPRYEALKEMRAFCAQKHIPLLLLWTPVRADFTKLNETALEMTEEELSKRFHKLAQNWQTVLIDEHKSAAPEEFADADHVNVLGALKISQDIADVINSSKIGRALP